MPNTIQEAIGSNELQLSRYDGGGKRKIFTQVHDEEMGRNLNMAVNKITRVYSEKKPFTEVLDT